MAGTLIPCDLHQPFDQIFTVPGQKPYACQQAFLRVPVRKEIQRNRSSVLG